MTRVPIRLCALAAAALLTAATPLPAQSARPRLPAWLAGCWRQQTGTTVTDEQWLAPRGGILLGAARTTRGDSLVNYEFMRIFVRRDALVFAAQPSGQAPSEFPARRHTAREIVFENLAHDFPQRVMYRSVGANSVHARIEGTIAGRTHGKDFRYVRRRCEQTEKAPVRRQ